MKNLKDIILIALTLIILGACNDEEDCITGNGNIINRDYTISDFSKLAIHGIADVYISKGQTTFLSIEGEENVLNLLDVSVKNNELSIGRDNCFKNIERLKIFVSTSTLSDIYSAGVCNIYSPDNFTASTFTANIEGEGLMNLNINAQEFNANISGIGDIMAIGKASTQSIVISGEGDIYCYELEGASGQITIDGKGDVEINVSTDLNVKISGLGNVYYMGNPTIEQKISGSGKVVKVD